MKKEEKKDTSKKKRKDQVLIDFIYQNILKKELFNIFKSKTYSNKKKEKYAIENINDKKENDNEIESEDEEYILFLRYIYNDVSSFIENNKNYLLKNYNFLDIEDLMIDICNTICHKTFKNIKTIFDSSDEKTNSNTYNFIKETYKEENNININDSFFFIPPLEYIVSYIIKLRDNDVDEFIKNNNFDKKNLLDKSLSTELLNNDIINKYSNLNNEEEIEQLESKRHLNNEQCVNNNEKDEKKYQNIEVQFFSLEEKNLQNKKDLEEEDIFINNKSIQDKFIYVNNKNVDCLNEKKYDELDENIHINYILSTDKIENNDYDISVYYENASIYKHSDIYDSSFEDTSNNTNSVLSHLEEKNINDFNSNIVNKNSFYNSYNFSSVLSKKYGSNTKFACNVSSKNEKVDEVLINNGKKEEKENIIYLNNEILKNNRDINNTLYHTINTMNSNNINEKDTEFNYLNEKGNIRSKNKYDSYKNHIYHVNHTKKDNLCEEIICNNIKNENSNTYKTNIYNYDISNVDVNNNDINNVDVNNNDINNVNANNNDINNDDVNNSDINNDDVNNSDISNVDVNNNDINNDDVNNNDINNDDVNNSDISNADVNNNDINNDDVNNNHINNDCVNNSDISNADVNNNDINNDDVNNNHINNDCVNNSDISNVDVNNNCNIINIKDTDINCNNANDIDINSKNGNPNFNINNINNINVNKNNYNYKNSNKKDINKKDFNDSNENAKNVNYKIKALNENINKLNSCMEQSRDKNYIEDIDNSAHNLSKENNKEEKKNILKINMLNEKNSKRNNNENKASKKFIEFDEKEYQEKLQKLLMNKNYLNNERKEFRKNNNLHDDYYYFKYLNNYENKINPYHYTRVERKANIQVTPSPFPQFLRDIQICNVPQKKIRLKKTNVILKKEEDNKKDVKKSKKKKNIIENKEKDKIT